MIDVNSCHKHFCRHNRIKETTEIFLNLYGANKIKQ